MTVRLDHTIVLGRDKLADALFLNYILGRNYGGRFARFAPVQLDDELNLDYAEAEDEKFERRSFGFLVSDEEFEGIVSRLQGERVPYGSEANQIDDGQINHRAGGRGLFFQDRNGHTFEITTQAYRMV
jgi:catechol 2,3-dioxygenase-like lactoylglutathione lyase family enzyme